MTETRYQGGLAEFWSAFSTLSRFRPLTVLGILLAGCAPLDQVDQLHPLAPTSPDLAWPGTGDEAIQVEQGVIASDGDCGLDYQLYLPAKAVGPGLAVLAHGFLGHKGHLEDLARALATSGVRTATLDLCPSPVGLAAETQGLDMVRLARGLGAAQVVYLGFSAGAQAALVAAYHDPGSRGMIALDPVANPSWGWLKGQHRNQPLIALVGEPGPCNLEGGGLHALTGLRSGWRIQRVPGAGHCEFASPAPSLCAWVCGNPAPDAGRRQAIIELAVAAVRELLGRESAPWPPLGSRVSR